MNKLMIVGNLTRDPEIREAGADGVPCCTFSVAVNRYVRGSDHPHADFFRVTAWRGLAENCAAYLAKGRKVLVEGRVRASAYINVRGEAQASLEVTAENVIFLTPRGEGAELGRTRADEDAGDGFAEVDEDELPF